MSPPPRISQLLLRLQPAACLRIPPHRLTGLTALPRCPSLLRLPRLLPFPFVRFSFFRYHDHAMGVTALNVYAGLVGPLLITDQRERALQVSGVMPSGRYDVPLVLKDYWSEQQQQKKKTVEQRRGAELDDSDAGPQRLRCNINRAHARARSSRDSGRFWASPTDHSLLLAVAVAERR